MSLLLNFSRSAVCVAARARDVEARGVIDSCLYLLLLLILLFINPMSCGYNVG